MKSEPRLVAEAGGRAGLTGQVGSSHPDDLMKSSVAERRPSWFKSTSITKSAVLMSIFRAEKVVQIV